MNKVDTEYFRIVNDILTNGKVKKNRTGIDTIGIFGAQAKYDVDLDAFPILTTKKVHFPAIVHELLWFISGSTNIKYLVDNDVKIWNEWAVKRYMEKTGAKGHISAILPIYVKNIKEDVEFAKQWGELGEGTYGGMWRKYPVTHYYNQDQLIKYSKIGDTIGSSDDGERYELFVDQLQKVINKLKFYPDDRRMIVSAWHPYWVDHCALPPCHCLFQFHTEELTLEERIEILQKQVGPVNLPKSEMWVIQKLAEENIPSRRLNCLLYQRSQDTALGNPFNVASYSLLTAMIAQTVNMTTGTFTHSTGDTHIYVNHLDGLKLQLTREPKKLPKLWLNPEVKSLFDFKYDDIKLLDYEFHPTIKFDVAV
ncbi:MAG: thymidylate synthase [bacterium]